MAEEAPCPGTRDRLVVVVFAFLVALPPLDLLFGFDPSPAPQEKRGLATLPADPPARTAWKAWRQRFEAWHQDHFGLRKTLLAGQARLRLMGLGAGKESVVVVGERDWLFLRKGLSAPAKGLPARFGDRELAAWVAHLRREGGRYAAAGARYLVTFPPNKSTIYPGLQAGGGPAPPSPSRMDQLYRALAREAGVATVDLRPAVRQVGPQVTYWPTDSHWNTFGSSRAAAALRRGIGEWFPEVATHEVAIRTRPAAPPRCDLAIALGVPDLCGEPGPALEAAPGQLEEVALEGPLAARMIQGAPPNQLWRGGHAERPRLLIMRDSFSENLIPFLAPAFSQVLSVWGTHVSREVVAAFRPDVVVLELVERTLDTPLATVLKVGTGGRAREPDG